MTGAEFTFVVSAGKTLLDIFQNDSQRAFACRERVSQYFQSISDTLDRISRSLSDGAIPTKDGNALKVLIGCFEVIIASNFYGETKISKKRNELLLPELLQSAENAYNVDYAINTKNKVTANGHPIDELILDISRTSGRFAAMASVMTAIGPIKVKLP